MKNSKKYLIWITIALIVFIVVICFASQIKEWFTSQLGWLIALGVSFAAGWLLGRFGGSRSCNQEQKNVRNITQAQK